MASMSATETTSVHSGARIDYTTQAKRRRLRSALLQMAGSGFLAGSVALFLADGGASLFGNLSDGLTAVGTLAGLLSMGLMCLMVILVARVPIIDDTFGQDAATVLHRQLGNWVVYLVAAHTVFILAGYSVGDDTDPLATFASLWDGNSDFIWACVALVLLIAVVLTSIMAVRRRFAYELWYAIHLLTYAAILASLPHQFSMSGILAPDTKSRWLWIAMMIFTLFLLLTFRVFLPIFTTIEQRPVVRAVTPVGVDAVSIEIECRRLDKLQARGGNWFQWRFLTPALFLQAHPFSLSAEPGQGAVRITVRNLGHGSGRLQRLRPGTRVFLEGPYGMFTESARTTSKVVLAGAGIGIAPIRALLEGMPDAGRDVAVILRASTGRELYLAEEVKRLCQARGLILFELVGNRAGASWLPASHSGQHLNDLVPWVAQADVFACGPDAWMAAFFEDARVCGVPATQQHREHFNW